jgi:hypothetical protein
MASWTSIRHEVSAGQEEQMSTLKLTLKVFAIVVLGMVGVIGIQM